MRDRHPRPARDPLGGRPASASALLAYDWRSLSGAGSERAAIARLEGLATWTESLRDTIAGAVGLEQAIPSSTRIAAPAIRQPLLRLVDRLHTRMPMADALRLFADDLDDASADLIIAALIINSRLRGPGLRDLLGALSRSVREELDMRRKVSAERRSTRRSVQIVIGVSVGMALVLAAHRPLVPRPVQHHRRPGRAGRHRGLYGVGIAWLRRLARFESPQRLLGGDRRGVAAAHRRGAVPAAAAAALAGAGHDDRGAGHRRADRARPVPAIFALIPRRASLAGRIAAFDASQRGAAARAPGGGSKGSARPR